MARKIAGPVPGATFNLIPSAFGNAEDPEPITVELRHPTEAEKRALRSSAPRAVFEVELDAKGATVPGKTARVELDTAASGERQINRRAFERLVVRVENYTAADGKPIDTGLRLFEHGERPIVLEVAAAIDRLFGLDEAEKKSSGG